MSGKAVSLGGSPAPSGPSVLLYVGPHTLPNSQNTKGAVLEEGRQFIPQTANERKLSVKDDTMENVNQMQFPTAFNGVSLNKESPHVHNILSIDNGLPLPPGYSCKPVIDPGNTNNINCVPGGMNNAFVGIQNLPDGQRIVQTDSFGHMIKVNDKSINGQVMSGNACTGNFVEQGQNSGSMMTLSRSDERLGSDAGESCSSMSSGDSHSEGSGNILIMPGQVHTQHNPNQILLNSNSNNILTRGPSGNILISNMTGQMDNNSIPNIPANYHMMNQAVAQQQHQMMNQGMSIVNNQQNMCVKSEQDQQQSSDSRDGSGCYDNSVVGSEISGVVRQSMDGEIVIVNNVAHHVVRTPGGGLVLGVLPRPRQVQGQCAPGPMSGGASILYPDNANTIGVPLGWSRRLQGNNIRYISPSGAVLCSLDQVREYLQSAGTCKCGLDCPLRPEAIFNFDPKVMSKPSEMRSGLKVGEMWRGCAGKRRAGPPCPSPTPSPTPPSPACPEDKKQQRNDGDLPAAKKRKRKGNPYSGVSVSQLLAQRENMQHHNMQQNQLQLHQFHQQQMFQNQSNAHHNPGLQHQNTWIHPHSMNPNVPHPCDSASPTISQMRYNNTPESCAINRNVIPSGNGPRNVVFHGPQQLSNKSDDSCNSIPPVDIQVNGKSNLGSQVLTINGNSQGCAVQDQRSLQQRVMFNANQQPNIQLAGVNHVVGQNGQIISIQAPNLSRSQSLGSISTNESRNKVCSDSDDIPKSDQSPFVSKICDNNSRDNEMKRNPNSLQILPNGLIVPPSQSQPSNQCNSNQIGIPDLHNLPPEVIERINQQQQIFIQQNQKQMELAMRSIKNHNVPGNPNVSTLEVKANQSDVQQLNQNMVMPSNQRVPPWQLNRLNAMHQVNQPRPVQSLNKMNVQYNNPPQNTGNQVSQKNPINDMNDFNRQKCGNDNIYSRVPPLHHDIPPAMWTEQEPKKKTKAKSTKKAKGHDNQANLNKPNQTITVTPMNHSPSCIEDPSGYLAQQAAYMSRQLGMAHMMNPCEDIPSNYETKNNSKAFNSRNNHNSNSSSHGPKNINRTMSQNSPSQSNLPDSSVNCDKSGEVNKHSHCQGCIAEMNESKSNYSVPYQTKIKNYMDSLSSTKSDSSSQPGTPSPNQCSDDSPVTSSTYGERPGSRSNNFSGPIQGRIISTSNGSPMEGYQVPELSPTPSNSSRNTDTPQSKTSNNGFNISSSCPYPNSSPAYSYQGSSRESVNSNPATPSPGNMNQNYSPEPMSNVHQMPPTSLSGKAEGIRGNGIQMTNGNSCVTQFSNSNNGNNIENVCPPMQAGPMSNNFNHQRIQQNQNVPFTFFMSSSGMQAMNNTGMPLSNEIVTTVAGHTLSRNTITSVLAGKAQTATTSVNGSASGMPQLYPPIGNPSAITHHTSLGQSNMPSNYPLHIAGSVVQSLVTKSPLEMVQNVVSNIRVSQAQNSSSVNQNGNNMQEKQPQVHNLNHSPVMMSGNNQILINSSGHGSVMAPPPPKGQPSDPPMSTSTTTSITQAIPAVGGVPQVINHPTVLVNTIPAPFMLQPQVVTVDGQVVNQNVQVPQIVAGNIIPQGQIVDGNNSSKSPGMINRPALLSPDNGKKKGKKRKPPSPVTSVMQIPTQHNSGNLLVQHNAQQSQQFVSQGFQVSPNGNISTTPMLQALTIVPGKGGGPAHIVMNGQAAGSFGSQQIINSQGPQHINLLQPVNLLNGPTGVVQNFPTFQQFIVPGLGGMVMTADGTAILQDPSSMPMQLQIQNVNGQNVLTPVQNQGILTAGPAGMVIRTQNPNNKMIQSQHSPGAQFLSPTGGQIVMGGSPFNGQLSPLIANVSPNQTVAFNNSPPQVRSTMQQEYLQCNQMGQTLMLPVSPNQMAVSSSSNQQNTTYVQQNTTIVQQQTTMVANNQNQYQNVSRNGQNSTTPILNVEHGIVVNQANNNKQNNQVKEKVQSNTSPQIQQITVQTPGDNSAVKRLAVPFTQIMNHGPQINPEVKSNDAQVQQMFANFNQNNVMNQQDLNNMMNPHYHHTNVSTQTLVNQQQSGNKSPIQPYSNQSSSGSPPDTTTHSPLGSLDGSNGSPANSLSGRSPNSVHGNHVDTTTASPEPVENNSLAMVQCVSSSEPDSMDSSNWGKPREKSMDMQVEMVHQNSASPQRQNNFYSVDSSGIHFNNQTITVSSLNNQQNLTITPANYYERNNLQKHNSNAANTITVMPPNNMEMNPMHCNERNAKMDSRSAIINKQNYYTSEKIPLHAMNNNMSQMNAQRSMENPNANCLSNNSYARRMSIAGTDESSMEDKNVTTNQPNHHLDIQSRQFKEGDLVWGPAKGYPAWPGKLVTKNTINGKEDGKVLVRWFGGDKCLTVLDSSNLQTLSEGLEAHHAARTKCRKSRKLNGQLEKAIQEAMAELDRITETKELFNEIKSEDMLVEDADINGNSSKSLMKTINRNNNKTVSEFVSKNESKSKWSNKKEPKTRGGGAVVKIAPHPGAINSNNVPAQPSGRLRSSQR